jgi:hypothetical protein
MDKIDAASDAFRAIIQRENDGIRQRELANVEKNEGRGLSGTRLIT